ncbi:MAG: UDP-3-O-acyl-N-acetylglucosamine deacetylase [Chthonomonadales bacterium]
MADAPQTSLVQRQTTLARSVVLEGFGLHTGAAARVTLSPAEANTGIVFYRAGVVIPAHACCVASTTRCTVLASEGVQVHTVEHLLSAVFALEVDNLTIEVEGTELPALDGSALPWARAILDAGIVPLEQQRMNATLLQPVVLNQGASWMVAVPADRPLLTCVTHFDHPLLGTQASFYDGSVSYYLSEIAPARTFGFVEEVDELNRAGLAQGGSLDNALIIFSDHFSTPERVEHECNRHKLLDLMGDLMLTGCRPAASVTAIRPSHTVNALFARALAEHLCTHPMKETLNAGR